MQQLEKKCDAEEGDKLCRLRWNAYRLWAQCRWSLKLLRYAAREDFGWKLKREERGGSIKFHGFKDGDGVWHSDKVYIEELLAGRLKYLFGDSTNLGVFEERMQSMQAEMDMRRKEVAEEIAQLFSQDCVREAIQTLPSKKACDGHGVRIDIIKELLADPAAVEIVRAIGINMAMPTQEAEARQDWSHLQLWMLSKSKMVGAPADIRFVALANVIEKVFHKCCLLAVFDMIIQCSSCGS